MDIHIGHNHSRMSSALLDTFFQVETTHWWWNGRKAILSSLLDMYLRGNKNVILDAGCGTGANILFLEKYGKVSGVDISSVATNFCRKRGIKNVKTGDISDLPYKSNSFDAVCLMDVLEHIEDEKVAIEEIFRVLKPKGKLLLTVPALPFIYSQHDREQGHFKRYTKKGLRTLFENTDFRELTINYFNMLLSPPIIVIRLLSRLKTFSKLADFDAKLNFDIHRVSPVNNLLSKIFSIERHLVMQFALPFGVSLLALYEKPKRSKDIVKRKY